MDEPYAEAPKTETAAKPLTPEQRQAIRVKKQGQAKEDLQKRKAAALKTAEEAQTKSIAAARQQATEAKATAKAAQEAEAKELAALREKASELGLRVHEAWNVNVLNHVISAFNRNTEAAAAAAKAAEPRVKAVQAELKKRAAAATQRAIAAKARRKTVPSLQVN